MYFIDGRMALALPHGIHVNFVEVMYKRTEPEDLLCMLDLKNTRPSAAST